VEGHTHNTASAQLPQPRCHISINNRHFIFDSSFLNNIDVGAKGEGGRWMFTLGVVNRSVTCFWPFSPCFLRDDCHSWSSGCLAGWCPRGCWGAEPTEVITRSRSAGIVNRLQLDLLLMEGCVGE